MVTELEDLLSWRIFIWISCNI